MEMEPLLGILGDYPQGVSPREILKHLPVSRPTLNRWLAHGVVSGKIARIGRGPATRYALTDPLAALRAYFEKPHTERRIARFDEALLQPEPGLSESAMTAIGAIPICSIDKRTFGKFLIDFSCASSVLEGGSYSLLDTQALIEYGEKAKGKPLEDAFLVLNHKEALEYLFENMRLEEIFRVHDLLTSDHDLAELAGSRHFLRREYRGVVREHADVDIAFSAYLPPFRPGTGYVGKMLDRILETAAKIANPIQASFYLLTRLPYLQPFQDGNKRVSRALCNVPLMLANLPPISFVDFGKKDYIVALLAFYELGDVRLFEKCFVEAYAKSIARLGLAN